MINSVKRPLRTAVVLGSGVMGAAIAAHFANAGLSVTLLDLPAAQGDRNGLARAGLERAQKAKPAAFFSSEQQRLVQVGNLEDDFVSAVERADLVLEAVIENLAVKQELLARIDAARGPETIVASNTSGLRLHEMAAGRSLGFRQHFLGMHFFNPPRYLRLLELTPIAETLPEVLALAQHWGEYRLGKGVVLCKDTPNFIANRFAVGSGAFALDFILRNGYTVEEVDALTGPLIGRPKTAFFRLLDLVGLDVWAQVERNQSTEAPHPLAQEMLSRGWLGNKTGIGFYKEVKLPGAKKEFWPLNLSTLEHQPPATPRFDSVKKAASIDELAPRLKMLLAADDRAGELIRALTWQGFQYAASLLPEAADTPLALDNALRWGFGHESGPFALWESLGLESSAQAMAGAGFPAPGWVQALIASGKSGFYQSENGQKTGVYDVSRAEYVPLERPAGVVTLSGASRVLHNSGASLHDTGDGVGLVTFHTKMNTLDDDIFELVTQTLERAETDFDALVLGSESDLFSAGANLFLVVMAAQQGMWEQLEAMARKFQMLNLRLRYFPKPIVAAPAGLALGGGAEIIMHTARVVASAELYAGLVEMGAGIIPAGAGSKEMLRRVLNPPMRTPNADGLPFLLRILEQVGQAKVTTSAEEARLAGFLTPADRVVLNPAHLLAEARREALHLAQSGYQPPVPETIYAAGRDALAALRIAIHTMYLGGYITEHEKKIAGKLAQVLTGGELSRPAWVSESYILELEREALLSLCGEEKTQARMWHILQNGRPLRN